MASVERLRVLSRVHIVPRSGHSQWVARFVAVLAALAGTPAALAQSDSIGGNIGGSGASSGGSVGGAIGGNIGSPPASPAAPARQQSPAVRRPAVVQRPQRATRAEAYVRRGRREESRGGAFDGLWSLSTASSCAGNGTGTFRVRGTRLIQGSGTVSPSGTFRAADRVHGLRNVYYGRLSGNSGGGSYRREDGCMGNWSAAR